MPVWMNLSSTAKVFAIRANITPWKPMIESKEPSIGEIAEALMLGKSKKPDASRAMPKSKSVIPGMRDRCSGVYNSMKRMFLQPSEKERSDDGAPFLLGK